MLRRPISHGPFAVAFVAFALLACGYDDGTTVEDQQLRDDVLHCEEAIAHLEKCCAGFIADQLACKHSVTTKQPSCGTTGDYSTDKEDPALSLDESRCILAMDCDSLDRQNVCKRAQAARAQRSGSSHYEDDETDHQYPPMSYSTPQEKVCP